MRYSSLQRLLPRVARDYIFHFEASIERAESEFARALPDGSRVLNAGAGKGKYANYFRRHHYCGVDLCIGDFQWDYSRVGVITNAM
jgi:hypothetical protein